MSSKRWKKYYKPVQHNCKICGEPVDRTIYGCRRYHDECIIDQFIEACNEGAGRNDPRKRRFWNYGFTKEDVEEFKRYGKAL
jgi:hypothetical protein